IIGPAIGGNLYAFGPVVPYLSAFVLLVIAAVLMFVLKPPAQEPVKEARTISMIAEGLRYVWSNKIILGAISTDLEVVLHAGGVALVQGYARDMIDAERAGKSIRRSSVGIGAAAVALILALKPLRRLVVMLLFGATTVFGIATVVFGLSQWLWI